MRRVVLAACAFGWLLAFAQPSRAGGGGGEICQPHRTRPGLLTVFVTDNCFTYKTLRVTTGSAVTWRLLGTFAPHTVSAENGLFESGDLSGPFTVRFNQPGRYPYVCTYHGGSWGGMRGTVVVTGAAVDGPEAEELVAESEVNEASARAVVPAPVVTVEVPAAGPVRASLSGPTTLALVVGMFASVLALAFLLRRGRA